MAKRDLYFSEAERLYVTDHCTVEEIASRLRLNEKTIRNWKAEGDWEGKRKIFLSSQQAFHTELYELTRSLVKSIREDIDAGRDVSASRLYTASKLIPNLIKVKEYEAAAAADKGGADSASAGLTPEVVKMIEQQVLGLERA
jgi:uncharacterized protein YjcR